MRLWWLSAHSGSVGLRWIFIASLLLLRTELTTCFLRCEAVTVESCLEFGYNSTSFPNFVGHDTQDQAAADVYQFSALRNFECSQLLRLFLCIVYIPPCTDRHRAIPPCRSLCENARAGCSRIFQAFGFSLPETLRCDRFPSTSDSSRGVICVDPETIPKYIIGDGSTTTTHSTETNEELPVHVRQSIYKCPRNLSKPDDPRYIFLGQQECTSPCQHILFTRSEQAFMRRWVFGWSATCFVCTAFNIATFLLDRRRFGYPERPILFFSLCYLVVSAVFVSSYFAGDALACHTSDGGVILQTQGTRRSGCTISFMLAYYFLLAAQLWWLLLCFSWFLSASRKWSQEALEAYSQYFHAVAWVAPATGTVAALALGQIDGDLLSGICFVGSTDVRTLRTYIVLPLLFSTVLGLVLLLIGLWSLQRIRKALQLNRTVNLRRLNKFMVRIGAFSIMFLLPTVSLLVCLFYDMLNRLGWERSYIDSWWESNLCRERQTYARSKNCTVNAVAQRRPDFSVFAAKYLLLLMVGITSGFWTWSPKTLRLWKVFFVRRVMGKPQSKQRTLSAKPLY